MLSSGSPPERRSVGQAGYFLPTDILISKKFRYGTQDVYGVIRVHSFLIRVNLSPLAAFAIPAMLTLYAAFGQDHHIRAGWADRSVSQISNGNFLGFFVG